MLHDDDAHKLASWGLQGHLEVNLFYVKPQTTDDVVHQGTTNSHKNNDIQEEG